MKLFEIIDTRHMIANDVKNNKGQGIKTIVQGTKRKTNANTDEHKFIADSPQDEETPSKIDA